jgi:hypothetical protein
MRVDGVEEDELRGILQRLVEQERIRGDHPRGVEGAILKGKSREE